MLPPFFRSSNSGFKVQLALQEKWQNLYGNGVLQNLYGNGVLTLMNNQKESTLSNKVIDEVWIFKQKSWEDIISHLFIVNIDKNERVYQTCFIANKSKDSGKINRNSEVEITFLMGELFCFVIGLLLPK